LFEALLDFCALYIGDSRSRSLSLSFEFVKSSLCSRKNGQQRQHHLRFRFR
jgi:hypothetical protein